MIVMKFGGTSLSSVDRLSRSIALVAAHRSHKPVVVVSALTGVTMAIDAAIQAALTGNRKRMTELTEWLSTCHTGMAQALDRPPDLIAQINEQVRIVKSAVESISVLREATPRARDFMVIVGARLSALLFATAMRKYGLRGVRGR